MARADYTKPFLEIKALLALMQTRGLDIDISIEEAEYYLSTVNYYRFTGYAIPFQTDREHFKPGAKFSDIQAIYAFDRELRDIVFSATEAVELTFRAILARTFTRKHGAIGHLDSANFPDPVAHATAVKWIQKEFDRSDELCARHFRANYNNPPLWALIEVVSFGSLVRFFKAITAYGMRGDALSSYLHHVSVFRNMCAHHARLIDHRFSYAFRPPKEWKSLHVQDTSAFFYQCALLYRLLAPTAPNCFCREAWRSRLCAHRDAIPVSSANDPHYRAAIPVDALASPLWL